MPKLIKILIISIIAILAMSIVLCQWYGLYLAFTASILLGIICLFIPPLAFWLAFSTLIINPNTVKLALDFLNHLIK